MASLYEISAEYADITAAMEAAETDDEMNVLMDALGAVNADFTAKADAYARIIRNYSSEAVRFKDEADRLAKTAKHYETICDRLKRSMYEAMQATDTLKLPVSIGTWSRRNNPPSVVVDDEAALPDVYKAFEPRILKRDILAALKAGEVVPGARMVRTEGIVFK